MSPSFSQSSRHHEVPSRGKALSEMLGQWAEAVLYKEAPKRQA